MTKFEKPGARSWDYPDMAKEAGTKAMLDAGVKYTDIEQAAVGYVYGDSTCGQRALYELGLTGIPVYNVNNNCSTGSTALVMAKQFIEGGLAECVLALGFEKMQRGSLTAQFADRTNPLGKHLEVMNDKRGITKAPFAPQMFGNAGIEHMEKYGTTQEQLAKVAWKNHKHSKNNPYAQFRDEYSMEQILKSPQVFGPLTKLQCCPTSEGAAAAVLASEAFVKAHGLEHQAVELAAMALTTDTNASFQGSMMDMVGYQMSKLAADKCYKATGLTANDVQVVELHDCFSANELINYEALGLCPPGQAGKFIDQGQFTYGGKYVVNPSGGLISKGHPLGATGLAQCAEICWQLRQMATNRQIPNCKVGLQHNIGLGGAAVVGIYRLGFPEKFKPFPKDKANPAIDSDTLKLHTPAPAAGGAAGGADLKSAKVFDGLKAKIAADPTLVSKVNAVYKFDVKGPNGGITSWIVDLKNGSGSVTQGANTAADLTLTMADDDLVALMTGKLEAQMAFVQGKLKMNGNMKFAMKLGDVIKSGSKL
jgi:sterol carrier protein 2